MRTIDPIAERTVNTHRQRRAHIWWAPLAGLCALTVLVSTPGWAQDATRAEPGAAGTATETAWQAASFLGTLPYGAAKVTFALIGGFAGGVGYVLSGGDLESAQAIWAGFMRGTYVLAPEHLKGERPIEFYVPPNGPERKPPLSGEVP